MGGLNCDRAGYLFGMSHKTEVLYNDTCPICSREVNHYARLSEAGELPIRYDRLSDEGTLDRWGISRDAAAKRFHLRKEGKTYSGLPAFIVLWREIPQTAWLARILSLPGIHWGASKIYDHIAAPLLFALHRRRQRKG